MLQPIMISKWCPLRINSLQQVILPHELHRCRWSTWQGLQPAPELQQSAWPAYEIDHETHEAGQEPEGLPDSTPNTGLNNMDDDAASVDFGGSEVFLNRRVI